MAIKSPKVSSSPPHSAADLDGRMVEIVSGNEGYHGFVGRALDLGQHGWIEVRLDATDPEDDRIAGPLAPEDVKIRPDLENVYGRN